MLSTSANHTGSLCSQGHHGPLCAVCEPNYYPDDEDRCVECGQMGAIFSANSLSRWLPLLLLLVFLIILVFGCCFARCLACGQKVLQSSLAAHVVLTMQTVVRTRGIWIPKVKIIISMWQVQEGIIPAFDVTLPELFVRFLNAINVW